MWRGGVGSGVGNSSWLSILSYGAGNFWRQTFGYSDCELCTQHIIERPVAVRLSQCANGEGGKEEEEEEGERKERGRDRGQGKGRMRQGKGSCLYSRTLIVL